MNKNSSGINNFLSQILQSLSLDSVVVEAIPLSGGDIHDVYLVANESSRYVVKVNTSEMPGDVFRLESDGLNALKVVGELRVPEVIGVMSEEEMSALVLEYLPSERGDILNFGQQLARHHKVAQAHFGWHVDNYIGRLPQVNTPTVSWEDFWAEHRIGPLVRALRDAASFTSSEVRVFDELIHRTAVLVPEESPSLLHGDLWSGNVLPTSSSYAVIDPAVYAGHREMDLAMMKLFGGFSAAAFDAYNDEYPLENQWEERMGFHQIYPLLVHARLFGGLYIHQSIEMARRYL
ncbi:MAG: hypothetical protein EP346_12375 [Bacteroidetes bacterium]|nr:MAG: hypothetical protein EP346_12375 [Bacteroidota bacterium]